MKDFGDFACRTTQRGEVAGALVQWPPPEGSDPHFVVFDLPAAAEHMADFVETLATAPPGSIGVR